MLIILGIFKEEFDLATPALGYFEGGDPHSTNLFVANLNSKITESHLMMEFGAYGPLASVKIMWPRGEEKQRNSNCGFVAFMSRKDAERALRENKNRDDMRVGWGKSVEIPAHPIYIPSELLKLYLPPPLSGLPFNAQPPESYKTTDEQEFNELLYNCVVKVTIPLNKKMLMLVHRMVEFVVKEGPMFEAFIMNREMGNPEFNFLFDYQSPVHVYYRWKLFSILNGDNKKNWPMNPFRMFKGGSIWLPPIEPNYTEGMPEQLINGDERAVDSTKLSESQTSRLINLIRNLSLNRSKIAEAMLFCLNHSLALNDAIDIIIESMKSLGTNPLKKIARLYLLSDVLFNSRRFKVDIESGDFDLMEAFKVFRESLNRMKTVCDKDNFRTRVLRVLHQWDVCGTISAGFVQKAVSLFLDSPEPTSNIDDDSSSIDEPLDGASLIKRSLRNEIGPDVVISSDLNEKREPPKKQISEYFVPSKWDTVDPEEVEAQAMSTHKMYYMELENQMKTTPVEERGGGG
ncbi:hypothetical protein NQ317_018555 [Molorchus minor]|uniref:U2 snRNP-associated SURP motif-containing protein n=1 Tax=Molorchus minor TaxID=1323400 RepID=A0ABQ9JX47_9CUCU|nr:hypothetical protein NQ317_018555 [Molorchus minor]